MYQQRRSRILQRPQQIHGNRYIQKLIRHVQSNGAQEKANQADMRFGALVADESAHKDKKNQKGVEVQQDVRLQRPVQREKGAVAEKVNPAKKKISRGVFGRIGKPVNKVPPK